MNNRIVFVMIVALLALLISSCSQGTPEVISATDTVPSFEFNDAEKAALALGDDSSLTVDFGDPSLGTAVLSAPPSNSQFASVTGQSAGSRTASTLANDCDGDRDCDCDQCQPEKCRKITGICNLTERFWQADDACDLEVDVTYEAEVTVEDGGNRAGIEVTFSRDGQVVGTALTDASGIATFTESGVARGPHKVTACVAASRTGACRLGQTCGDPLCPTHEEECKPQITVVFTRTSVVATSTKDLSNLVLKFCDGSTKKFDGLRGTTGTFMGYGRYAGKTIAGAWIKSGCNSSGDGPGYGEWFANPFSDCECKPCITYDGCSNCSSTESEGKFCSTQDIAVYTDQIWGAVTGTGYIDACNPLRIGSRAGMNFRAAYDNGAVQGYLNFWDGSIKVTNGQIKWLVISGVESWFGGDNWIVRVVDNGKDFRNDTFEIWITDPVTKCCYHCGGRLVGCYVNISYRYTQPCP